MSSQEYIDAAGKEAGVEVWRIEESELAPIPKKFYGTFYNGDSYVVLSTKALKSGGFEWDVHFWLGEKTEQVEAGAAALWAVTVDDEVAGGAAVQHREVQGHESKAFIGLFKKGLIYEEGGVASGFNHVEPNDYSEINRLLWVRGKNPVRCTQVACSWESLNKSDCFILDMGNDIYTWCGEFSSVWERSKANEMARAIRDDERGGRAEVHIIDAGEVRCPEKLCPVLGDDIPDDIPDEAPEDAPAKKGAPRSGAGKLFKVSGEDGEVDYSLVAEEGPYEQSLLEDENVFVLASVDGPAIYVWKGKNSSPEERSKAIDYCNQYMEKNDLPAHTQFEIMPQFAESAMFKQFFVDWQDLNETDGLGETYTVGSVAKVEHEEFDASTMHDTPETAAEYGMPDDGSGEKKVYRIVDSEREEVPEENWGIFYSNECYIVSYTYETPKGKPESYIYYWLGNSAGTSAETATAFQVVQLDNEEFDGDALQVRVTEGKEPNHLIAMFNGGMAILQQGSYCEPAPRNALFQIRLNRANQVKAFETEFSAAALNSNDTFFAVAEGDSDYGFGGDCFAWFGTGADDKEKEALTAFAAKIGADGNITEINEGEESDEFWDFLGGQEEYFKLPRKQEKPRVPRLFECSMATGNFVAEELLGVLHQSDLNPANVMLLDAWNTVFVWIGQESSDDEKEQTLEAAKQYLATDPAGRKGTPIVQVKQEKEPVTFTGFFAGWDEEFWANATNFEYDS
ncbi:Oidioi.mRNA.OKI2018_I69.chr1.g1201.t1.cds [Oikopleura dioica]|uniref:Oidioi.mRNA.OKI2018_I69.chr1.g1201.t1.cds n=1 Tax=Oikopleura dioica TaxID=34765 RepID=A0ABN7SS83_OIKDI|nr:Oidioi.mRNA.OKI2018_I69.chr1.g1201.t1.cds [Oikopleura dioica]